MEVKQSRTPEETATRRLRNSGDAANADYVIHKGEGPTRTITNVHLSGSAKQHGEGHPGEGDIRGNKRGVV
jgi:hypothetical protein